VKHDPPRTYGDCITACIGSILEREDVPNFNTGQGGVELWAVIRDWLTVEGYNLVLLPFREDPRPLMQEMQNDGYYFLMCSNGQENHAVVCRGDERVHDPSWYSTPITGPLENGYWIVGVVW
jgi:hypothetical protein